MGRAKQILVVLLVAVLMCLSACGQAGDNSKKQTDSNDAQTGNYVTLKAITLGQLPENGMDEFYEELDAMTEELGCHLRFDYIPWGDERSQLNMAIASGKYDFISNGNFSDYYQQVAKGAFLNLNAYRDVVPELRNMLDHAQILGVKNISTTLIFINRHIFTRTGLFHDRIFPSAWMGTCPTIGITASEIIG